MIVIKIHYVSHVYKIEGSIALNYAKKEPIMTKPVNVVLKHNEMNNISERISLFIIQN